MKKEKFRFTVEGYNLDYLIKLLYKKGYDLSNVEKTGERKLKFTIRKDENEKIFAFLNRACYNVTRTPVGGVSTAMTLLRKTGVVLGIILFAFISFLSDDFLLKIKVEGSAAVYESEINDYLESEGICLYKPFKSIDLEDLEKKINALGYVGFATVEKRGSCLKVRAEIYDGGPEVFEKKYQPLLSPVSGVVEWISSVRGDILVKSGDSVKKGQPLIDCRYSVGEEKVETFPIGTVKIKYLFISEYVLEYDEETSVKTAIILAMAESQDNGTGECTVSSINKTEDGNYRITITRECAEIVVGG